MDDSTVPEVRRRDRGYELSHREVAALLEISPERVRQLELRAISKLRKSLRQLAKDHGIIPDQ